MHACAHARHTRTQQCVRARVHACGLCVCGIIAEIVFGQGAIFGASVVGNLSGIVAAIGGENGFIGLVAIILIFALLRKRA